MSKKDGKKGQKRKLSKEDIEVMEKMRNVPGTHVYLPKEILKKPSRYETMDSYYGMINFYKWSKIPGKHGSEFSPIFFYLDELKKEYPKEIEILELICRKTAYLCTLKEEIDYISNRFEWKEIDWIEEVFLSRFESFTTSLVELILISINFHETGVLKRDKDETEVIKFEDILSFLRNPEHNLPSYYNSINESINLCIYAYIRNSIVHNPKELEYLKNNQNPIIQIKDMPFVKRKEYGVFNDYLEEVFKLSKCKKSQNTYQKCIDPRFPYLEFELWVNKKSRLGLEKTKVKFKMDIIKLTDMMLDDLFILQKDIFKTIIDSN